MSSRESEQLDLVDAIDEAEGLAPWFETKFRTPPITAEQLARRVRTPCSPQDMERVLREEERNGRVERDGDGWRISQDFLAECGQDFRNLSLGVDIDEDAA